MTVLTSNLSLVTYSGSGTDQSGSFITWQQDMSGSSNSNMTKIDTWAGGVSGSINNLSGSLSGSMSSTTGSMNNLSGSIVTINANISALQLRFTKLYQFDGAGQIDFQNIPQTYKHIFIVGVAGGNYNQPFTDVGIDFNGDANSSNYSAAQWNRSGLPDFEYIQVYTTGQILIANVPGAMDGINYGGAFVAIIPNYSATAGFYKSAMGMSAMASDTTRYSAGLQGGFWKSQAAINRIRMFASSDSSARINFLTGTSISLYGLG